MLVFAIEGPRNISEENNKEGIETIFKTSVSSISGGKYYRFDYIASWIALLRFTYS